MQFYSDNFALVLGTWHPYKVAVESIFYNMLDTFLGQAFHSVFPNKKITPKPRLSHLEHFFNQLSVAYPTFRRQLLALYANCPRGHPFKHDIQNLHDLFEFFLPLVCNFYLFFFFFASLNFFFMLVNFSNFRVNNWLGSRLRNKRQVGNLSRCHGFLFAASFDFHLRQKLALYASISFAILHIFLLEKL